MVGGGITILESRSRGAAGRRATVFTAGHIEFRQSLLVRVTNAVRLGRHQGLTSADRVGVLAGTTDEARLLELTGLAGAGGVLAAGTTPGLHDRRHLQPAGADQPQVVYLPDEVALTEALAAGEIDAVARGEIGNLVAASGAEGTFIVTALDFRVETGGFAVASADAELRLASTGISLG